MLDIESDGQIPQLRWVTNDSVAACGLLIPLADATFVSTIVSFRENRGPHELLTS